MSSERAPMRFDQVSHAAIQHTKLHFLQRFGTYGKSSYQIKEYDKNTFRMQHNSKTFCDSQKVMIDSVMMMVVVYNSLR